MTISDKSPGLSKLRAIKRKTVTLSPDDLVSTSLVGGRHLPLMITPNTDTLDLPAWAAENRESLRTRLRMHGALLFRGFAVPTVDTFAATVSSVSAEPLRYTERSSPRHTVSGHIYTSTDHPPEYPIFLHNEQSYNLSWCRVISFHCRTAAATGGQTPLADTRRILTRLDPAVVDSFRRRRYMYMRNFGDGFGLSWQEAFQTDSKAEVEAYCRANRIDVEWKSQHRLRTRQVRDAVHRHPDTGELVWFNHCTFFHVSTLPAPVRDALQAGFADDELPNQTFYGDGGAIEPEVMTHLQDTYLAEKLAFDWEAGDVLIVDNMLCAHGREPFSGERRVLTAMSELADGYRAGPDHGATP
jgi:alpha-ketoglutarate-dependent taurine dioxygenase